MVAARGETDFAKRKQMYADMQTMIHEKAGIGIPVYSPDGLNWVELPLLASPNLPEGQEMGFFRYDDGTIVILTRKIGG